MRSTFDKHSVQHPRHASCLALAGLLSLCGLSLHLSSASGMMAGSAAWVRMTPPASGLLLGLGLPYPLLALAYALRAPQSLIGRPLLWGSGALVYGGAAIHGLLLRAAAAEPAGSRQVAYEWLVTHLALSSTLGLHLTWAAALSAHVAFGTSCWLSRWTRTAGPARYLGAVAAALLFAVQWNVLGYLAAGAAPLAGPGLGAQTMDEAPEVAHGHAFPARVAFSHDTGR